MICSLMCSLMCRPRAVLEGLYASCRGQKTQFKEISACKGAQGPATTTNPVPATPPPQRPPRYVCVWGGGGGFVRYMGREGAASKGCLRPKRVCVPKISLKYPGPWVDSSFLQRKRLLNGVGGQPPHPHCSAMPWAQLSRCKTVPCRSGSSVLFLRMSVEQTDVL